MTSSQAEFFYLNPSKIDKMPTIVDVKFSTDKNEKIYLQSITPFPISAQSRKLAPAQIKHLAEHWPFFLWDGKSVTRIRLTHDNKKVEMTTETTTFTWASFQKEYPAYNFDSLLSRLPVSDTVNDDDDLNSSILNVSTSSSTFDVDGLTVSPEFSPVVIVPESTQKNGLEDEGADDAPRFQLYAQFSAVGSAFESPEKNTSSQQETGTVVYASGDPIYTLSVANDHFSSDQLQDIAEIITTLESALHVRLKLLIDAERFYVRLAELGAADANLLLDQVTNLAKLGIDSFTYINANKCWEKMLPRSDLDVTVSYGSTYGGAEQRDSCIGNPSPGGLDKYTAEFEDARSEYLAHLRKIKKPVTPTTTTDSCVDDSTKGTTEVASVRASVTQSSKPRCFSKKIETDSASVIVPVPVSRSAVSEMPNAQKQVRFKPATPNANNVVESNARTVNAFPGASLEPACRYTAWDDDPLVPVTSHFLFLCAFQQLPATKQGAVIYMLGFGMLVIATGGTSLLGAGVATAATILGYAGASMMITGAAMMFFNAPKPGHREQQPDLSSSYCL